MIFLIVRKAGHILDHQGLYDTEGQDGGPRKSFGQADAASKEGIVELA